MNPIPENIPSWIPTILTGVGSIISGIVVGILSYKKQTKRLHTDWEKAQTELKKAGTSEFEAINAGNKALREALMEQVRAGYQENERLRREHDKCDEALERQYRRIRILERLLTKNNIQFTVEIENNDY